MIIEVNQGSTLDVNVLTLTHGTGAIDLEIGTIVLTNSALSNNKNGNGARIYSDAGNVTVVMIPLDLLG